MDADLSLLARFPYLPDAQKYVRDANVPIEKLLDGPAYRRVLERGKTRLIDAIQRGEVRPPATSNPEVELFSYPVARMLISCIKDRYLIVRYAEAESKLARSYLEKERDLPAIAKEMGVKTLRRDDGLWLHYTEYVSLASRVGDDDFRFANQVVSRGFVQTADRQLVRLLQEAVRHKVRSGLPLPVTPAICEALQHLSAQVSDALQRRRKEYEAAGVAALPDCYPPCMARLLDSLRSGENLSHTARFALTTFLHHVGLEEDSILEIYRASPDFDEDTALYQIRHVCSKGDEGYTPPSCMTMQTYGNCIEPDRLCARVKHPLSYYRAALKSRRNAGDAEKVPEGETKKNDGGAPDGDGESA